MRLLFVTQDFPPDIGGIQTYSWELAPRLARRCDQFRLLAPARPGDTEIDASLDFPVSRLPIRSDLLVLRTIPAVFRLARRMSIDVAFHVQWQTALASLFVRRFMGTPARLAVTLHGRDTVFNPFDRSPLRQGYDFLRRTAVRGADHVLPVSQFLARRAHHLGVSDSQISTVSNATNPDVFYPDPAPSLRSELDAEGRPIVLTAGRMVPKKGFDTALRALERVRDEVPNVLLLLAGTGPEESSLKQLAQELNLEAHVRFLGDLSQDQLRRHYTLADVFMMVGREVPNDVEGFGLVYLEANACGTPVIGAQAGGVPDAVRDGETGLLVPPEDPAAAAEALTHLLTTPEFAQRLGQQGRERIQKEANWDRVADRIYTLLYRDMDEG